LDVIFGMVAIFNPNTTAVKSISVNSIIYIYSPQHMPADEMKIQT